MKCDMRLTKHPTDAEIDYNQQVRLALIVDQNEEHILIGTTEDIDRTLKGESSSSLLCYSKRPVGTFLLSFENDGKSWTEALDYLQQGYTLLMHSALDKIKDLQRKESVLDYEKRALDILQAKVDSDDPICKYAALRIWYAYWGIRNHPYNFSSSEFDNCVESMRNLVRPFQENPRTITSGAELQLDNLISNGVNPMLPCDTTRILRIAPNQQVSEYILADWSILPLKEYYAQFIEKKKMHICQCVLCGNLYITANRQRKYCSDSCRKIFDQQKRAERRQNPL